MKKVAFKTLGCRLNIFETDSIVSQFSSNGYNIVDFNEEADVYIINTCTVTNQSDHKSRQEISRSNKKNKDAITVVTGCMATNYKEKLKEKHDIDYVIDNDHKTSVFSIVDAHAKGEIVAPENYEKDLFGYEAAKDTFHTRSFIKIQDGCNQFCTYCIIPKVRGRATSRPVGEVIENIKKVIEYGFKEVVLTGVNLGRYEYEGVNFEALVERILDIPGDFRIRISSIEPDGYSESFFRLFENPKLTPHMHICLQSGSENILKRMRRMYTANEFANLIQNVRKKYPQFNVTTDIIVGFPGETEEEFNETYEFIKKVKFGHIHTFKYSLRKGTRAERFPDHLSDRIKSERSEIIRKTSEHHRLEYRKNFIGKTQTVLVEKTETNYAYGHGENYIPIKIKGNDFKSNNFYKVVIVDIDNNGDEPILIARMT
ncbi:MAG: tRNA (N(6)-L-threonylcarbamoyladenosine(37)-C(2))-methylthiotransferase MtaB [Marinilabiliales bacterium]|nr:MAG: tRNA (N(6)-L-threonylcarbamoyladenosine(37)-C(2))-methylthiotransferase MtaB [Marinilabiliales bacterium]